MNLGPTSAIDVMRIAHDSLDYREDGLYYYEDLPFTGSAFFIGKGDWLEAEGEFRQGMRCGCCKGWYRSGCVKYEEHCRNGLLHGLRKEWHLTGSPAAEEHFEYGIRTRGRRWESNGVLLEDFQLDELSPDFETLKTYRAAYKKAGLD